LIFSFPRVCSLKTVEVAAQQYYFVAEILLAVHNPLLSGVTIGKPERQVVEDHALRVCGIAFTNENVSARVNAFWSYLSVSLRLKW
jgi:hypothetical protein